MKLNLNHNYYLIWLNSIKAGRYGWLLSSSSDWHFLVEVEKSRWGWIFSESALTAWQLVRAELQRFIKNWSLAKLFEFFKIDFPTKFVKILFDRLKMPPTFRSWKNLNRKLRSDVWTTRWMTVGQIEKGSFFWRYEMTEDISGFKNVLMRYKALRNSAINFVNLLDFLCLQSTNENFRPDLLATTDINIYSYIKGI